MSIVFHLASKSEALSGFPDALACKRKLKILDQEYDNKIDEQLWLHRFLDGTSDKLNLRLYINLMLLVVKLMN